jgi:hypothetical protein
MKTSAHAIAIRCSATSRVAARAEVKGTFVHQSYLSMLQLPKLRSNPGGIVKSTVVSFTGLTCDGTRPDSLLPGQGTTLHQDWHGSDSRVPGYRGKRNGMPIQETLSQTLAVA